MDKHAQDIVSNLIESGAERVFKEKQILEIGLEKFYNAVIKSCLDKGDDVNIQVNGMPAIHYACLNNKYDTVKLLLEYNAEINNIAIPLYKNYLIR